MKSRPLSLSAAAALAAAIWPQPATHAAGVRRAFSERLRLEVSCTSPVSLLRLTADVTRDPRSGASEALLSLGSASGNGVSYKQSTNVTDCRIPLDALQVSRDGSVRLEVHALRSDQACASYSTWLAYPIPEPLPPPVIELSLTGAPDDWTAQAHATEKWQSKEGRYTAQSRTDSWSVATNVQLPGGAHCDASVEQRTYQKITAD